MTPEDELLAGALSALQSFYMDDTQGLIRGVATNIFMLRMLKGSSVEAILQEAFPSLKEAIKEELERIENEQRASSS